MTLQDDTLIFNYRELSRLERVALSSLERQKKARLEALEDKAFCLIALEPAAKDILGRVYANNNNIHVSVTSLKQLTV